MQPGEEGKLSSRTGIQYTLICNWAKPAELSPSPSAIFSSFCMRDIGRRKVTSNTCVHYAARDNSRSPRRPVAWRFINLRYCKSINKRAGSLAVSLFAVLPPGRSFPPSRQPRRAGTPAATSPIGVRVYFRRFVGGGIDSPPPPVNIATGPRGTYRFVVYLQ